MGLADVFGEHNAISENKLGWGRLEQHRAANVSLTSAAASKERKYDVLVVNGDFFNCNLVS